MNTQQDEARMSDSENVAITVLGPVNQAELGITMAHDHILIHQPLVSDYERDGDDSLRPVQDETKAQWPVTMENLGWIRQNWLSNRDNLVLDDEPVAIQELKRYRGAGGTTIVDPTTEGLGRNPRALARISEATGVNIILGSGLYVEETQPSWTRRLSVDQIAQLIIDDIRTGIGETGIRAGVIGEIGCTFPLRQSEQKSLRAAAIAQEEVQAALVVHPGRDASSPFEIVDHLDLAGANLEKVVISHLDRTIQKVDQLTALAKSGVYLEFDMFGLETSLYPYFWTGIDVLSDAQRLDLVEELIAAQWADKLLVGQDICTKHRLSTYGGHGYDHILTNIIPWMRRRGASESDITRIAISNPARAFSLGAS